MTSSFSMKLGDSLFYKIIRQYLNTHAYGTATTHDFIQTCEDVYGQSLDWFFDPWLFNPGYPRLAFTWEQRQTAAKSLQAQSFTVILNIKQAAWDAPVYRLRLPMEFHGPEGTGNDTSIILWLDSAGQTFNIDLPWSVEVVVLDPERDLLMRVMEPVQAFWIPEIMREPMVLEAWPNPVQYECECKLFNGELGIQILAYMI